jgi:hypothetical protein
MYPVDHRVISKHKLVAHYTFVKSLIVRKHGTQLGFLLDRGIRLNGNSNYETLKGEPDSQESNFHNLAN